MKLLKILGIAVAVAVALAGGLVVVLAASFDSAWVKKQVAMAVQEKKQRSLTIDGDMSLSLWPALNLHLGKVALSEHQRSEQFAAIEDARISVALRPLLSGRLVVDAIELRGLRARLVRREDGSLNIDDLLATDPKSGPLRLRVAGLRLADAEVSWRDEGSGKTTTLTGLGLDAGAIEVDTGPQAYRVASIDVAARLAGIDPVALQLSGSDIDSRAGSVQVGRLALAVDARADGRAAKLRLTGPLSARLDRKSVNLDRLEGSLDIASPGSSMKPAHMPLAGQLRADLAKGSAQGALTARLDDSKIALRLDLTRFSPPSLGFELDIDQMDLDKYLPAAQTGAGRTTGGPGGADVSALQGVDLRGLVAIGRLQFAGIETRNVRLKVSLRDGRLDYGDLAGEAIKAKAKERIRQEAGQDLRGLQFGK